MAETEAPSLDDAQDMVAMDWKRDDDKFTITLKYGHAEVVITDTQTEFEDGQPGDLELLFATLPECIELVMQQAFPKEENDG